MTLPTDPLRDRMIFVVGARRSGTHWLQRIVGAHPEVAVVPSETYLFSRGIRPLRERFHQGVLGSGMTGVLYMDRDALVSSFRALCDRAFLPFLEASPGATRLVERTPEHATCLDLIGEIYPDAHVVHIIRDGRDVARSLLAQDWGTAPRSIEAAAEEWRSSVDAAEDVGPSLQWFQTVRYEDLLADPASQVRQLYGRLGLSTDVSIVEAALLEADVATNVDPTSPSIRAGKWRDSFTARDLEVFSRVAGATLARLGYAAGPGTTPAAETARGFGRAFRSRSRRGPSKSTAPPGVARGPRVAKLLADSERTMTRVVAAMTSHERSDLTSLVGPSSWVRVVSGADDWSGRGAEAIDRFVDTITADDALRGRQVAGDVHPGIPTSSAVMRFAGSDGTEHVRVVVATIQDEEVTRLTYYRFAPGSG